MESQRCSRFALLDHFEGSTAGTTRMFQSKVNVVNIKWGRKETDNSRRIFTRRVLEFIPHYSVAKRIQI